MKFLKGLGIVVLTLIAIYIVLALFAPKDYEVTRKIEINAPADVIFEQVTNFKNWEKWSPWIEKDPTVKNTYTGDFAKIGSKMSWIGNEDLSGTGSMEITALTQNKEVSYDLAFVVPFESKSKGGMTLAEKEGKTILTWFDKGDIPFMMRPFMMFMDLDAKIGTDFERGLARIDSVSQEEVKYAITKQLEITETTFPANNYVAIRHNTTMAEVMTSEFYKNNFQKLGMYMGENQSKLSGMPSAIYYSWNEVDSTTEIALAFPLEGLTKVEKEGYEFISLKGQKAILAKSYGPYENTQEAHFKIDAYAKSKGFKVGLVIEEYANDPAAVSHPSEILTNIYYLIEE